MDNKMTPTRFFSSKMFNTKATIILAMLFNNLFIQAQCPCGTGCTTTISTTVSTNFTVTAGQTLCIVPPGNITGSITVNGGTVNNSSTITPSALNYTFSGTINNCGTITGSFNIYMDGATDFLYNCSGATLHLTSGNITMNGGGYFKNDGQITMDNGNILDQGGDMFINNGTITINNGGDFTQNGTNGGFCNNGTINMTSVGSRFLGNGDGSSNHGTINTYDFDLNGNNFYNACNINVLHDFYANGGSMTGPTTAGQYGRYTITGSSGYNGTDIGIGGSRLDICDLGGPGWNSTNGGSIGTNVTYCVNTATCIGSGSCTIPCTLPSTPTISGTSTICPGGSTTLTSSGSGPYLWNTGATTSSISVSPSSNTTYTVTITNGCGSVQRVQAVTVNSAPTPGITGTSTICNGASTSLTGTGGGTYVWNTGASTATINVSPSTNTTYTVTVTNGSGCTALTTRAVTVNSLPTPGITGGGTPICNGNNITLTGTGGGTYNWNTGATSTAITVSPSSTTTYTVTVTNASGCTSRATQVVTVNSNPTPGITGTATICSGKSTTLTGTGGGTYSWNTGATSTAITVSPGANTTYTVTVTNASGCTSTIAQVVTVNTTPTANITGTTTICNGASTTLTGTGGGTYSWNTGAGTTSISVSPSSNTTYTVTVTSGAGCTATAAQGIIVNAVPSTTMGSTPATCGVSNGTATVTATGPATLTYVWSPSGQTTSTATGLSSGSYNVTVTDGNGCTSNASVSVNNATSPTASLVSQTNVLCTGAATGTATVTGTGGTGTLTYLWSPGGQTTTSVTGLTAGTYIATVTDANGCAQGQSVTITQPASVITPTISSQNNVGCTGAATGSATVTGTGGTGAYTYSWSPGGQTTASVSGLTTGAYTVLITDANGCTAQQMVAITQPASSLGSTISSQSNVGCTGAATGTATVTGTGGTPTYTYSWSPGGQTTASVSGLTTGAYTVLITDANGCTRQQAVTITQPASALSSTISSQSNVGCTGAATGTATVTGIGGTPTYTYSWNTGATTPSITGLTTGNYNVLITDANGCTAQQTVAITQPASSIGSTITSQSNVGCIGAATGTATVTGTGGTPTYTYNWSPGGQTTASVSGLTTGSYNVTVTDVNGCTTVQTVNITQPASAISSNIASQDVVDCKGNATGGATVTATGGTPGYTYNWSPSGGTDSIATNLSAGNYNVTITDMNGCTTVQPVTIIEPTFNLGLSTSGLSNVGCTGSATGTASVTATGGTPNYSYTWQPMGSTGPNAAFLTAGTYTVTVVDIKGCSTEQTVTITEPVSALSSTINSTDATCGNTNGTATVTATGGTPSYTYSWAPTGGTNSTAIGLSAGAYVVLITDSNGCIETANVAVNNALAPDITVLSQSPVGCTGSATGSATVTVTGGTPSYTYNWTPMGGTGTTAVGLTAGNYNFTVTDANGCIKVESIAITQPASTLGSTITSQNNVGCTGSATGSATVTGTGGTPGYTYSWSPGGQTTADVSGLTSGSYNVTITDANGCTNIQTVNIIQPAAAINAGISSIGAVGCTGSASGSATVTVTGGTPSYNYSWSPGGNTTSNVSGLTSGSYVVTVTDFYGCSTSQSVAITQPASGLNSSIVGSLGNVGCTGSATGSATITGVGGTPSYFYNWNTGETTNSISGLTAGTYSVTVTDNNGCTSTQSVAITQPASVLSSTIVGSLGNVGCTGSATGTATITGVGGTPIYLYNWNTGETTNSISGLTAGTYSVTVTDNNVCTSTQTVTITEPSTVLSSSIVGSLGNVGCTGSATGTATITGVGGTPSYFYNWNTGETTNSISSLTAGTYSVTVTDNNGCTSTQAVTISEPVSVVSATTTTANAACGSSNGTASVSGVGGTPGFTYVWSVGGDTNATITGLTAGTYTVVVTDANGCTAITTAVVNGSPGPSLTVFSQNNITCNGLTNGSATLTVSSGTAPYSYNWSPNVGSSNTISGLSTGIYTVIVSDSAGCMDTTTFTITQPLPMTFSLTTDVASICSGEALTLLTSNLIGGTPPYTFNWLPNGPVVTPLIPTTYSVTVTDSSGCVSLVDTIRVIPLTSPIANFDTISSGIFNQKYNFTDLSTGGTNWYWDFGDGTTSTLQNPYHTFPGAGTYTVTQVVIAPSGCKDTITKIIVILPNIIIPNVFTPNHDGINDEFWIPNTGFETFELTIYDRWGLKLFVTNQGEIRWDGRTTAGNEAPDGTYYYLLQAVLKTENGGKKYEGKGFIDLHRSK